MNTPVEPGDPAGLENISTSSRMQDFERGCALILAKLYGSFPVPLNIRIKALEPNVGGEIERTFAATMEFLSKEGYLGYGSAHGPRARGLTWNNDFSDVVLTAKGLTVLDAIPPVLRSAAGATPRGAG